jgi:hypothetical protein
MVSRTYNIQCGGLAFEVFLFDSYEFFAFRLSCLYSPAIILSIWKRIALMDSENIVNFSSFLLIRSCLWIQMNFYPNPDRPANHTGSNTTVVTYSKDGKRERENNNK